MEKREVLKERQSTDWRARVAQCGARQHDLVEKGQNEKERAGNKPRKKEANR